MKTTNYNLNLIEKSDRILNTLDDLNENFNNIDSELYEKEKELATTKQKLERTEQRLEKAENKIEQAEAILDTSKSSGENVYFDNAKNYPMMSLKGEGKSEQVTTTGKNLFPLRTTITVNGVTFTNNGDGTFNLSGTATAKADFYVRNDNSNVAIGEKYTFKATTKTSGVNYKIQDVNDNTWLKDLMIYYSGDNVRTFTINALNGNKISYVVEVLSGTTVNETNCKIQLEKGEIATEFEPYTNGQATSNPEYPQEIKTIQGYNLFDKDNAPVIYGYTSSSTGTIVADSTTRLSYIKCKPNTTYTAQKISGYLFNLSYSNVEPAIGTSFEGRKTSNGTVLTITTGENAEYLIIEYYKNDTNAQVIRDSIQIVEGNKLKPYAPYGCIPYIGRGKNLIDLTKLDASTPVMLKTAGGSASDISSNAFTFTSNETWSNLYLVFPENYFAKNEDIIISAKFLETVSGRTSPVGFIISGSNTSKDANDYVEIARNYQNINYNTSKFISATANVGTYKYIRIRVWCNSTNTSVASGESVVKVSELMLEKGTEATSFELPQESTVAIDLQGNELASVGTVSDKLLIDRKGNVAIEKNIWKMIIDGTENLQMNYGESLFNFAHKTKQKKPYSKNCISNYYLYDPRESSMNSMVDNTFGLQGNYTGVFFRDTRFADVESFKTHVASLYANGNPIEIYYELATPELISLGTISNPEIFKGINNIVIETNLGNMQVEIEYVEDTRKVFEERLANLEQAIVSLANV